MKGKRFRNHCRYKRLRYISDATKIRRCVPRRSLTHPGRTDDGAQSVQSSGVWPHQRMQCGREARLSGVRAAVTWAAGECACVDAAAATTAQQRARAWSDPRGRGDDRPNAGSRPPGEVFAFDPAPVHTSLRGGKHGIIMLAHKGGRGIASGPIEHAGHRSSHLSALPAAHAHSCSSLLLS